MADGASACGSAEGTVNVKTILRSHQQNNEDDTVGQYHSGRTFSCITYLIFGVII